jgi:hypothetical protein
MAAAKILVQSHGRGRSPLAPDPETGWYLLGGVGWLFSVVAAADLVLAWYPLNFGNAEWEFGTATTLLEHLPLVAVGLSLVYGSAVARGARPTLRGVSVLFLVLLAVVILSGALIARHIGEAQASAADPVLLAGINRSILTSLIQTAAYSFGFGWLAFKGWKHAGSA